MVFTFMKNFIIFTAQFKYLKYSNLFYLQMFNSVSLIKLNNFDKFQFKSNYFSENFSIV